MSQKLEFPQGFLWGAATASYQIEGAVDEDGRGPSIWDTFSRTPGKVKNGDTGAIACDHYHLYRDDVALLKRIGVSAYRFSIAWPRILPQGTGEVNRAGLDFYDRLVDELLANDIQPWATLYHWDLPQALEDQGGWPERVVVDPFVNYVDVISRRLGDRVKHWMTLNEPWVFTFLGYGIGVHAPGRTDMQDYLRASHHALLAHGRSVPLLRTNVGDAAKVGVVLNLAWADPATDSQEDRDAVHRYDGFQNRWFLDPIYKGSYPADMLELYNAELPIQDGDLDEIRGKPDFLGVNFYNRTVLAHNPDAEDPLKIRQVPQTQNEHTAMGWEVSPESLYNLLVHTNREYNPGAIYITENGAAFLDEVGPDGEVDDPRRMAFYREYLAQAHRAIEAGVPLRGYFAWSLLDNFEWAEGYDKRFGITYVDYETQRRILKGSGKWYSQAIKQNGFELEVG
jgi:beta-glucosidase